MVIYNYSGGERKELLRLTDKVVTKINCDKVGWKLSRFLTFRQMTFCNSTSRGVVRQNDQFGCKVVRL